MNSENLQLTIIRHPLIVSPEILLLDVIVLINQTQGNLPIKDSKSLEDSTKEIGNITLQADSCVLVMENSQLVGMFTQRDLIKLTAEGKSLENVSIAEVMTKELVTLGIKEFKSAFTALNLLKQYRICHLPILGEKGEVIGLVTPTSLLAVTIQQAGLYNYARVKLAERQRIETELRLERNFVSAILNLADALVVVLDCQGRIVRFNHTCEQTTGYLFDEVKGKFIWDVLVSPEKNECIKAIFQDFAYRELANRYETYLVNKDSDRRLIYWSNNILLNRDDQIEYIVCTGIDITESRKAQEELEQTRNFLQSIINNLPVALFVKDAKPENFGTFKLWNQTSEHIFGITAEQAIGKTDYEFFPKEQADLFHQKDKEAFSTGIPQDISEELIDSPSFGRRILHTTKIPLYDKNQQPEYLLCISEDITERKQTEAALRESEQKFRLFTENIKSTFWITDIRKDTPQIVYVSPAFEEIWGRSPEEAYTSSDTLLETIHQSDRQRFLADTPKRTQGEHDEEYRIVRPDGAIRWIRSRAFPVKNDKEQVYRITGIAEDITERKQAEIALQSLIESTASTIGHDFFPALVEYIASALDVRHAMVTEFIDGQVHTLGFWSDGQLQSNICYEPTSSQGSNYSASGIQQLFPTAVENSMGVILSDDFGNSIGSLYIVDEKPIPEPHKFEGILKVFAARASAELQRKRAQEALQQLNRDLEARVEQRTLELQESEAELRAIVNQAAVGIKLETLDGQFLKVNQKLCEILGYSQEELLNKIYKDITYSDDIEYHVNNLQKLILGEVETFSIEKRCLHKNGNLIWINLTCSLIRDVTGKPIYSIGIVKDIQNQKQAEEELKRQLAAVEAAIDGIAILSQDSYIYMNKAHVEMFGYGSVNELIGKHWTEIYQPDEINRFQTEVFPILRQQKHWRGEAIAKRKDGTFFDEEVSLTISEQGDLICVARDITQRKESERLMNEQKAFLRSIIDNNPNCIFVKDRKDKFLLVNQAMADFHNTTIQQFVGKTDAEFYADVELEQLQNHDQNVLTTLKPIQMLKSSIRKATGEKCYFQSIKIPLIAPNGEVRGILGVATDITERKKAEEQICKALEKEKELSDLKSRFISMTSHEFRTPLAVIASSAGILKSFSHKLDEEQKQKHLQCIQTYVQHTTKLLDDILLINKAEAGKLAFEPSYFDLVAFCDTLIDKLQLSSPNHHLVFSAEYLGSSSDSNNFMAYMDKKLLQQILSDLLSNAVKYSPINSNIQLDLLIEDKIAVFLIKDKGIGISLEDQQHLFESFYRGSNVGNTPGTGLGLTIAAKCVYLHQGRIIFVSQLGVGTTFRVELPLIATNAFT